MEHFRIAPGDTRFTPLAFDYYPWSHSLVMDLAWAAGLGLLYLARRGDRRGAWVIAALVVSHWVLDWITHRPDMPITPSNDHRFGLGLWNHVGLTIGVETLLFGLGAVVYSRLTVAKDRVGRFGLWTLVVLLYAIYVGTIFGPPPPNTMIVKVSALALWILVPIAGWIDQHRALRTATAPPHTN
jgi:membrane-bound metal-dependent hydrolase YbcI (DUF457 family)